MIVSFFTLYLIVLFYCTKANSFVFEDGGRRFRAPFRQDSSAAQRRLGSHFRSTTISNVLNIPTTLIRTTSAAAQTFAPDNADKIEKVFDIPVQTLQAIGNFVKDMTPPSINRRHFNDQQDERLVELMKKNHQQQQLQQQEQEQKILSLQNQQKQNDEHISQRHVFGRFGWAPALTDFFFGGNKNLFGHDRFIFGGGGRRGHKKKKKNKLGLFGGHGQGNNADDDPSFNNDKDIYQIYNDFNILPNGLFTWNPTRKSDRIQNKIAPGFDDE